LRFLGFALRCGRDWAGSLSRLSSSAVTVTMTVEPDINSVAFSVQRVEQAIWTRASAGHRDPQGCGYSCRVLSRSALVMTLTEDRAMAAAAMMGESSSPKAG
jgi:hypothetical protein